MASYYIAVHKCKTCGETDPDKFYNGTKNECRSCILTRKKAQRLLDGGKLKESGWAAGLKRNFGLSVDAYNQMLESQEQRCAICGKHAETLPRRLAVDHCHETGKVRALLCHHCNAGLGHYFDNIHLLSKAIEYLSEHARDNGSRN